MRRSVILKVFIDCRKKKTVKLPKRSPRYAHTDHIFVNNDILMLSSILNFEICKFTHRDFYKNKIINLTPRSSDHSYNTRYNTDFSLSHVRTNLAASVEMYNSFPNELKCIDDFQDFK